MTDPKSFAFYGSTLTVMVPAAAPSWRDAAVVIIAVLISLTWYTGLALLFSHAAVRRVFENVNTGVEAVMGLVLVAMGGRLLLSR